MLFLLAMACTSGTPNDSAIAEDTDSDAVVAPEVEPISVRFGTFNVSLFRDREGQLVSDLSDPTLEQAVLLGKTIDSVLPDVLLVNEVDFDAAGDAVRLLQSNFLEQDYEHVYVAPSNTGVHSGFDLDNDGSTASTPGSQQYGGDAFGFGEFEGQYAFAVLSKHPLGTPRTFQNFLWKDLPDAWLPDDWFTPEELDVVRLSSKNHVDLPVLIGESTVHFLISHPTPPSFDGPEDRNGRRNHDEIAFWAHYLDADADGWPVDDLGVQGGLGGASFVIAGDLNADPRDGGSSDRPMALLLDHPRVQDPLPTSAGGAEQAGLQGGINDSHITDPAQDTADFSDWEVGNLRLDYTLPSDDLTIVDSGVFWPATTEPEFDWVGTFPFPATDHRLTWVDLEVAQ